MSRVFEATEVALGRVVVIKLLAPDVAAGVRSDRFKQEILLAANLRHPHIVPVLTAGTADGMLFYTMPYISGESLAQRIAHSPRLPVTQAMEIAEQVKPLERRVFDAHRAGEIKADDIPGQIDEAEKKGILTPAEAEAVRAFDRRMLDVTGVDDFDPSELRRHGA